MESSQQTEHLSPHQELNALEVEDPRITYAYKRLKRDNDIKSPTGNRAKQMILPAVKYKSTLLRPSSLLGTNKNLRIGALFAPEYNF